MTSEHDIIVVDDHPLFRRGVIQLLKMDPSFNVVAEAGDFEAAMVAVRERDCSSGSKHEAHQRC